MRGRVTGSCLGPCRAKKGVPGFLLLDRCFLLPVFGVAAVFSVAGKAGFCIAAVFSVAANAEFSVARLVFYVAALVFTVAGTVCSVATRCFMCPHGVLCCRTCWLYQQECRAIEFHGCRGKDYQN